MTSSALVDESHSMCVRETGLNKGIISVKSYLVENSSNGMESSNVFNHKP